MRRWRPRKVSPCPVAMRLTTQDETAYRILGAMGLHVTELEGNIYLPNTSVTGEVPDTWTAEFIRNSITERFQSAGVTCRRCSARWWATTRGKVKRQVGRPFSPPLSATSGDRGGKLPCPCITNT